VLDAIIAHKRVEVRARLTSPLSSLLQGLPPSTRSLEAALRQRGRRFVLEAKRKSPSRGGIHPGLSAEDVVEAYEHVADAISVLTDAHFFGGDFDILRNIASKTALPVLCKDFVVDVRQVAEARRHGADAILLMLSVLDDDTAAKCLDLCAQLQMDALVEAHDEQELRRALSLGASLVGINNRNLKTLHVDLNVTRRLAPLVPDHVTLVSESGIGSRADAKDLGSLVDGFLVGSALTGAGDMAAAARSLVVGDVKVCGLTSVEDAQVACDAGASHLGVIFAEQSKRRVTPEVARQVALSTRLPTVGVFTTHDVDAIVDTVTRSGLQAVQLHGGHDDRARQMLRERLPAHIDIWQAVGVDVQASAVDVDDLPDLNSVDRLLFDTAVGGRSGGTGQAFAHDALRAVPQLHRHALAGGLTPDNIQHADAVGVGLLDVNSGVEDAPGVKNPQKLRALFDALRGEGRRHAA